MRSVLIAVMLCLSLGSAIGDASLTRATHAGERERIQAHLAFVLADLRARDVAALPPAARRARAAALDHLARYLARGVFPRRAGDGYAGRRPRFIDDRGVHCAVGQLIADSGAPALARAIAERYEYAYVAAIAEPALAAWADAHGFTRTELAMIQPTYGEPPREHLVRNDIANRSTSIMLACAREHPLMARVPLHVEGDHRGHVWVTTASRERFATCFASLASRASFRVRADRRLVTFAFDLTVPLLPPQDHLDAALQRFRDHACVPRSGAIPREAHVDVTSHRDALVVRVTTTPANPEVASCLEQAIDAALRPDFGPGAWELHASRTLLLPCPANAPTRADSRSRPCARP